VEQTCKDAAHLNQ